MGFARASRELLTTHQVFQGTKPLRFRLKVELR